MWSESVMCGVMKSTGFYADAGSWARSTPLVASAGAAVSAIATARPRVVRVRRRRAGMRPNGLMEAALEEQRFEQRREKEEGNQAEKRGARWQPERLHDDQRIHTKHDEAKNRADAPPGHGVRLGR